MARSVSIMQMPEELTREQQKAFLREVEQAVDIDHPNLVLDCSNLRRAGSDIIRLLLQCLEEAMKRNGDVRLARVCPQVKAALDQTGAARLFRIYNSDVEAMESYHQPFATQAPIEFERHTSI